MCLHMVYATHRSGLHYLYPSIRSPHPCNALSLLHDADTSFAGAGGYLRKSILQVTAQQLRMVKLTGEMGREPRAKAASFGATRTIDVPDLPQEPVEELISILLRIMPCQA